jgi:hypothetical protein
MSRHSRPKDGVASARLDRGIQYAAALVVARTVLEIGGSGILGRPVKPGDDMVPPRIKKAGQMPAVSKTRPGLACPGGARLHPGLKNYFFFLALDFFAFFAFFAFLAIVSSQSLMD